MKTLIFVLLCLVQLKAADITVTVTLSDAAQWALSQVQSRAAANGDTASGAMKVPDFAVLYMSQIVTNLVTVEKTQALEVIKKKVETANAVIQASVQTTLGIASKDVIPADAPAK